MKVRIVVTIAGILLASSVRAQEPPSWVNLGDVPQATQIRDFLELPSLSRILACGLFPGGPYARVWKTVDDGQSWQTVLNWSSGAPAVQLLLDSSSSRIWCVRANAYDPLAYSDDFGESWNQVGGPNTNPAIVGQTIEVIGNYLYFGGSIENPYSISLYRLRTDSLTWEMVTQYPQCSGITKLKVHNGNLLVFAKDKTTSVIRVFIYTPSELDAKATPMGKTKVAPVEPAESNR